MTKGSEAITYKEKLKKMGFKLRKMNREEGGNL